MPSGFQSYTSDGRLQFYSDYMSYYFHSKGTKVMTQTGLSIANDPKYTDPTEGKLWTYPITYNENGPVDAIPFVENDIIIYACNTPLISTEGLQPATNVADQTLNWWRFRPFSTFVPPSSSLGLQIFGADAALAYDSNPKPLLLRYKVENIVMSAGMSTAVGLPTGRTYAGYATRISTRVGTTYSSPSSNPVPNAFMSGFKAVAGNDVFLSEVADLAFASENMNLGSILIFDVTGY